MNLSCQRLQLRELSEPDFVFLRKLECNMRVIKFNSDNIPSVQDVDNKYTDIMKWKDEKPRYKYCFIVTKSEDNVHVGKVTLKMLNKAIREWEIGWAFHPDHWGNGYATEAAKAIIEFAIKQLNAHRITAFCNAENVSSEKVMQKIGMKREGFLRQTRMLGGCWKDELVYSFLDIDLNYKPPAKFLDFAVF